LNYDHRSVAFAQLKQEAPFDFDRNNPALGLTWNPRETLTIYGSYNEAMRIPTPVFFRTSAPRAAWI
jgi:outer membrane receptor protein involved in Fe transport